MKPSSGRVDAVVDFRGKRIHLRVDPEDHIGKGIVSNRAFYEHEMLADLLLLITEGDLVVDVGANIGNHTVFFAGVGGCRVEAFEPNPAAIELLEENVGANGLGDRVRIHACAVGAADARAAMQESPAGNLGATRFTTRADGDFPVVALDSATFPGRVTLLKIDAEGMDFDVLHGAERLLERERPVLVVECQTTDEFAKMAGWLGARAYAAIACYNATETYVFLPARGADELARVTRFAMRQTVRTQVDARAIRRSLRRIGREFAPIAAAKLPAAFASLERRHAQLLSRVERLERRTTAGTDGDQAPFRGSVE